LFLPAESWAIRLKGSPRVIGCISLEEDRFRPEANSKEMGYSLSENYWRQGIMTEAAAEVIRFAFEELGLDQIGICTGPENLRSKRVIEKCGFRYEGTIRRTYKIYDGTLRDSLIFSMLREEYEERKRGSSS
jgi:putative acetyltransferase